MENEMNIENFSVRGYVNMIDRIDMLEEDYGIDIPEESTIETQAITSLIRDSLLPAVLFHQFCYEDNYELVTRRSLNSKIGFPKSIYTSSKIQKQVITSIVTSLSYAGNGADINLSNSVGERVDMLRL